MPSVVALLEVREARAREELESWLQVLREAEKEAQAARERMEHARIAREEVGSVLAEQGAAGLAVPAGASSVAPVTAGAAAVPAGGRPAAGSADRVLRAGYEPRPPVWEPGMGAGVLCGVYRQLFEAVVAAPGPVSAQELAGALGWDAARHNVVERVRHRVYALEARGWLVRERGVFTPAAGAVAGGGTRASAGAPLPSAG